MTARALDEVLADAPGLRVRRRVGAGSPVVTGITLDSRSVGPGSLFCCVRGERIDGHRFGPAAVTAGAVALLVEHELDVDVPQLVVDDVRAATGPLAAAVHGHPSRQLVLVGVTGTNGKTTTAHLLAHVLESNGWPCGVIGTLTGPRTTPEAPDLQAQLAAFAAEGRRAVVMEVSSHALALHGKKCSRVTRSCPRANMHGRRILCAVTLPYANNTSNWVLPISFLF